MSDMLEKAIQTAKEAFSRFEAEMQALQEMLLSKAAQEEEYEVVKEEELRNLIDYDVEYCRVPPRRTYSHSLSPPAHRLLGNHKAQGSSDCQLACNQEKRRLKHDAT